MTRSKLAILLVTAIALAGCGHKFPATANGECGVFEAPQEPVAGKTRKDQFWIDKTVETGVRVCDWPRPAGTHK